MKKIIDDFSDKVKVQVGNRVHVDIKDVPKKWRIMETGIITGINTEFVHTPEMRRFQITVRLDGDQRYWGSIGPILHASQKQLTLLQPKNSTMKYFKGDIVEIITSEFKSVQDVPSHKIGQYRNRKPVPYVGQRFRVVHAADHNEIQTLYGEYSNAIGNLTWCMNVTSCEVFLYRRPFKNYLKSLFQ